MLSIKNYFRILHKCLISRARNWTTNFRVLTIKQYQNLYNLKNNLGYKYIIKGKSISWLYNEMY